MSSTIAMIPMPALSGVLITTGAGMLNPSEFKHCYAVQKSDVVPFAATIGGMVAMGLAEGIGIGCATALGMNMYQTYTTKSSLTGVEASQESKMKAFELIQLPTGESKTDDNMIWQSRCGTQLPIQLDARGMHTMTSSSSSEKTFSDTSMMDPSKNTIWQLNGPINFLSMFEIDNMIKKIEGQDSTEAIVMDMQGVTMIEFTGVEELVTRVIEASDDHGGCPIQMINLTEEMEKALDQCDTTGRITRISFHQ